MNHPTPSPFLTSNFYLSAYLIAHDFVLEGCDRADGGRATFIFRPSRDLPEHVEKFVIGSGAMVNALAFVNAIKRLKSVIYDG